LINGYFEKRMHFLDTGFKLHLKYFVTIIDAAFVLNTHIRDKRDLSDASEKIKNVVDERQNPEHCVPNLLLGLHMHYWSKLQKETEDKMTNFNLAIRYLEEYRNCKSIFFTYFFDAWYGTYCKYFQSIITIGGHESLIR